MNDIFFEGTAGPLATPFPPVPVTCRLLTDGRDLLEVSQGPACRHVVAFRERREQITVNSSSYCRHNHRACTRPRREGQG